jgi:hypothetical protein
MKRTIPENLTLTDRQVREIIERAARIVPRSDRVTLSELRQIAAELDIAQDALEQALTDVVRPATTFRRFRDWCGRQLTRLGHIADHLLPRRARLLSASTSGGLLGWASAYLMSLAPLTIGPIHLIRGAGAIIDVPVALTLILLTLANSLSRRVQGGLGKYLRESWALWLSFGVGWSVTHGQVTDDILRWLALCLFGLTLWGVLVVRGGGSGDSADFVSGVDEAPRIAGSETEHGNTMTRASRPAWRGRVSPTCLRLVRSP